MMLELLGTVAGNVVSLPGVLGLGLGLLTRRLFLAGILGGMVGLVETLIFIQFEFAEIGALELIISLLVGVTAGLIGCFIRRKGAKI